jgi:dihydroorotate dehydrogenase (fumarate)
MPPIPLGNAAGMVKTLADLHPLLRVPSDMLHKITLGSYTLEPRSGNEGQSFWTDGNPCPMSINSLGLPNPGIDAACDFLHEATSLIHASKKVPRVSIAGFSPEEYRTMTQKLLNLGIYQIELNLGCPNVWDGGAQKRITSFVPSLIRETLEGVYDVADHVGAPSIAVKLSAYSDPFLLEEVAKVLSDMHRVVHTVVTCNTFPNATGFDKDGSMLISATKGFGGLAGLPLKHIALGQVRAFRSLLPAKIGIIGVGGIAEGRDVLDMERAGAEAVQVGTAFFAHSDPRVFSEIAAGYAELTSLEPA